MKQHWNSCSGPPIRLKRYLKPTSSNLLPSGAQNEDVGTASQTSLRSAWCRLHKYSWSGIGSLPRIPEVALPPRPAPPHSVDNKAAVLSYPKGQNMENGLKQSIIRWYYELNQGVNHEHSCVFKIWSDQELNSWPIHLAGQHCDYSTLSGIAIHSHIVNFLFKGNDLRLICMQTAPAII